MVQISIIIAIVFILLLLIVILAMPTRSGAVAKKKKKEQLQEQQEQKNWELIATRVQKHNSQLRDEVIVLQKKEKDLQKALLIEQEKAKKFHEKLTQERGWQEKEGKDLEKTNKQLQGLKGQLVEAQENYAKEHAENLRFDRELNQRKTEVNELQEIRRKLELQVKGLTEEGVALRREVAELKRENADLAKKKEDTAWVAKSDYLELEKKLKEVEKERDRLKQ